MPSSAFHLCNPDLFPASEQASPAVGAPPSPSCLPQLSLTCPEPCAVGLCGGLSLPSWSVESCVRACFSSGLKSVPLQDSAVTSVPCPQALRVRRWWCWEGCMFPPGRRSRLAALQTCGEAEGHARCLDPWAVFSSRLFPYVKIAVSPPVHVGPGGSGTHKTESGTAESQRSIGLFARG